jgi:hypothetical protein
VRLGQAPIHFRAELHSSLSLFECGQRTQVTHFAMLAACVLCGLQVVACTAALNLHWWVLQTHTLAAHTMPAYSSDALCTCNHIHAASGGSRHARQAGWPPPQSADAVMRVLYNCTCCAVLLCWHLQDAFTTATRHELVHTDIRVTSICPGEQQATMKHTGRSPNLCRIRSICSCRIANKPLHVLFLYLQRL